jgi:uncharacterized protein (DUF736 family)
MAIIGNFTKSENGYNGSVKTATVSVKAGEKTISQERRAVE